MDILALVNAIVLARQAGLISERDAKEKVNSALSRAIVKVSRG